jgi:hypothetical protein
VWSKGFAVATPRRVKFYKEHVMLTNCSVKDSIRECENVAARHNTVFRFLLRKGRKGTVKQQTHRIHFKA